MYCHFLSSNVHRSDQEWTGKTDPLGCCLKLSRRSAYIPVVKRFMVTKNNILTLRYTPRQHSLKPDSIWIRIERMTMTNLTLTCRSEGCLLVTKNKIQIKTNTAADSPLLPAFIFLTSHHHSSNSHVTGNLDKKNVVALELRIYAI